MLATKEQEINLLHQALMIDLSIADEGENKAIQSLMGKDNYESAKEATASAAASGYITASRRSGTSLGDLSGAGNKSYLEYAASIGQRSNYPRSNSGGSN